MKHGHEINNTAGGSVDFCNDRYIKNVHLGIYLNTLVKLLTMFIIVKEDEVGGACSPNGEKEKCV
jgi:hypothetical protein